jgi:hypothetical protein
VGPDYQYDLYWVPFQNEDGVTEKYKFTIIGSSEKERDDWYESLDEGPGHL